MTRRFQMAGACLCAAVMASAAPETSATNAVLTVANLVAGATNTAVRVETMPAGGWSWNELARLAGERADKAKIQFIRASAKRQQLDADLAWKDPQLRLGRSWEDERVRSTGEPRSYGDGDQFTAGVRFYIANPFVNRYIRRSGNAEVEALEARARTEQYAVYCEVKSLCLEEERLRREQRRRAEASELWERVRLSLERRLEKGVVKSPLDVIHAEVAREKARAQADEAALMRRVVRRQIAFYAGVPERGMLIRYTPPEPPATNRAFAAALWDAAFERRPDLVGARAELAAARAQVGMAKAAYLPWFNFVEGSYSYSTASDDSWRGSYLKRNLQSLHKTSREDEWQVRVAITVPIFTWFGSQVRASRVVEEMQDLRVRSLCDSLRNEIEVAMDDFRAADVLFTRLSEQGGSFVKRMRARIDEFANSSTVKPDDICRAQLELLDYRKFKDEAEYEWVSRILLLETVSGGPLPYGAEVAAPPPATGK